MATGPVFLPGESHGQRSLAGYSPWGRKESDTTEWLSTHSCTFCLREFRVRRRAHPKNVPGHTSAHLWRAGRRPPMWTLWTHSGWSPGWMPSPSLIQMTSRHVPSLPRWSPAITWLKSKGQLDSTRALAFLLSFLFTFPVTQSCSLGITLPNKRLSHMPSSQALLWGNPG